MLVTAVAIAACSLDALALPEKGLVLHVRQLCFLWIWDGALQTAWQPQAALQQRPWDERCLQRRRDRGFPPLLTEAHRFFTCLPARRYDSCGHIP